MLDPDAGRVRYKGSKGKFSRLPCTRNEAAMTGGLLAVVRRAWHKGAGS